METVQLLMLVIVLLVSIVAIFHRSIKPGHAHAAPHKLTITVRDPVLARHALIDQANAFCNRPSTPFPVALITGRRLRRPKHGITTVPYGPHWRALRSNLTAAILHPWRLGLLAPLHRQAVESLVTGLRAQDSGHVVVVRDSVYPAVFALLTRLTFGDGVDPNHMLAMQQMMQEFRVAIGEARDFAASSVLSKLVHWRRWRRFLSFRSQQAAMFLPLIAARRRQSTSCGKGNEGRFRPYVDTLIDLLIPDINNDANKTRALLINRPEVQRKLRHELLTDNHSDGLFSDELLGKMPYLHAVVLESLRLHPPFPLALRDVNTEGAVVGNATTPSGGMMKVYFKLRDIGKDIKTWTQPDEFRPERFLAGGEGDIKTWTQPDEFPGAKDIRMMPFGAGHRACPGAGLGVLYIKCFLAALVRDFEWAPPDEGSAIGGVDMTELFGFITVMKKPLEARMARVA